MDGLASLSVSKLSDGIHEMTDKVVVNSNPA